MQFSTFISQLPQWSNAPLPGESAHRMLAPEARRRFFEQNQGYAHMNPKQAAVVALFYPDALGEAHLALIKRSGHPGVHADQIGFPGGRREADDLDFWHTAQRECREEVGVPEANITLIRPLTPLYIPPSNFEVFPFAAYCHDLPQWQLQSAEVRALLPLPVSQLLQPNWLQYPESQQPGFDWSPHYIWGATAMMLQEIRGLLWPQLLS